MAENKTIEQIAADGGANNVTIRGVSIDIKPGSGLVFRCPECKRTLIRTKPGPDDFECRIHGRVGNVDAVPDLRVKSEWARESTECEIVEDEVLHEDPGRDPRRIRGIVEDNPDSDFIIVHRRDRDVMIARRFVITIELRSKRTGTK